MSRYTGPKNRLARKEGIDLGLKTVGTKAHASLLRRLTVPPGQHGPKGKRKMSEFGEQLREKQKVKRMYGVGERQFRKNFLHAKKWKGNTGDKLIELMERRLDNVIYRLGFAPTRASARQLVSHGHVRVDEGKVKTPSYMIAEGQIITFRTKGLTVPIVKKSLEMKDVVVPLWLARQGAAGKIVRLPERSDVTDDISEQLIIEHYSR